MKKIIDNPELQKYRQRFDPGQAIFWEGEESRDLFILVSGELNVLKGDKVIAHIDEPGTIFGELSFLLGGRRTATIKALGVAEVLAIPHEELKSLHQQFPGMAEEISRVLAERLDQASQVVYGLREFCDQLPDAVVLSDDEGRIISLNRAAVELYGRDYAHLRGTLLEELYEDANVFKELSEAARTGRPVRETTLAINHPLKGRRWISLSMNSLLDGRKNFQGFLTLGRDITASHKSRQRFQRIFWVLLPVFLLLGGYAILDVLDVSFLAKDGVTIASQKHEVQNLLAKDFFMLKSLLKDQFRPANREASHPLLLKFQALQDKKTSPYQAVILLDRNKRVFDAVIIKGRGDAESMLGNTYSRIEFQGRADSLHRVLSGYRRDAGQASSYRAVEMAFKVKQGEAVIGWIVFQMDMEMLNQQTNLDEEALKGFLFVEP
ncbi:hypothetical protein AAU61_19280 [Desulfocarbo indianensis]|nr:hypothetical protein AAU61_19280 [Desulfocarbo indianensis]